MSIESHVLARRIVVDVIVASPDEFGVNGRREARLACHRTASHGLQSIRPLHLFGRARKGMAPHTTIASEVPLEWLPATFVSPNLGRGGYLLTNSNRRVNCDLEKSCQPFAFEKALLRQLPGQS